MYEKYPQCDRHSHTFTQTCVHIYIYSAAGRVAQPVSTGFILVGIARIHSSRSFNGIFKWHARSYLHSALRGPPTKFFPREKYYDPPRAFYGGGHDSQTLHKNCEQEGKTVETVVCHALKILLIKQRILLKGKLNIFKYMFAEFLKFLR